MFFNILLTQHFFVVKHFHVTVLNMLENVLCLLGDNQIYIYEPT